jgi:hypothetical protein
MRVNIGVKTWIFKIVSPAKKQPIESRFQPMEWIGNRLKMKTLNTWTKDKRIVSVK